MTFEEALEMKRIELEAIERIINNMYKQRKHTIIVGRLVLLDLYEKKAETERLIKELEKRV